MEPQPFGRRLGSKRARKLLQAGVADAERLKPAPTEVARLLEADLTWTLGCTSAQAKDLVRRQGGTCSGDPMEAAENVQQHLHDTFMDTTWPACPSHPNHPLWLDEGHGRIWCCPRDGREVAPLGALSDVVDRPTALQAARAQQALAADEAEYKRWWAQ